MNDVLPILSLALSVVQLILLVPLWGKVFFSKHSVEYRPIEEIVKIRQGLGMEAPDPIETAQDSARETVSQLFGRPPEPMDPLTFFRPETRFRDEKRPAAGSDHDSEALAHTDQDRHIL